MASLSSINNLKGTLSSGALISGVLKKKQNLSGDLYKNSEYSYYTGPYEVFPDMEPQVLNTQDKAMNRNVVVQGIQIGLATIRQIDGLF